ncbi:MAG: 16S rRNA (adenine(1518)-N(6)/adenine(1519)-N(6))-dimethyltransferase RsmA [Oscillospiraceae bacterium]|nr:16S rRNA (adenine(1518)-N(6)/adenine(1519)-N(6))-dimethyltransferase RsmA [Oscillospiraceae bacterium]
MLKALLAKHDFTFRKSLGQNFLIDPWIADACVAALNLDGETGVLEIGPGAGALTVRLTEKAAAVTALELDERLLPVLHEVAKSATVIHVDMLKADLPKICRENLPNKRCVAIANLPYYITAQAISVLLASNCFERIVIMVQKEVVARLIAKPGDAALTALSMLVQLQTEVEPLFDVGRHCFMPSPNVDSAVVRLTQREVQPSAVCLTLVKVGYASRRKMLQNNLSARWPREVVMEALQAAGIDGSVRAETLQCDDWKRLAAHFDGRGKADDCRTLERL